MGWKREKPSALSYSVHYLSYRPRSVTEVVLALKKKQYTQGEVEEAVTELIEKGLLDDRSFSESWINYRKNQSVRSRNFVRQELRTKGIAAAIIEESLEEYYPQEAEREILLSLIARQWQSLTHGLLGDFPTGKGVDDSSNDEPLTKITEKLLRKYAGKGFSPYLVREVLSEIRGRME